MMKQLILTVLIVLVAFTLVAGQDGGSICPNEGIEEIVYPFECLHELGLDDIEARSIWMGYDSPAPWDIPDDTRIAGTMRGNGWEVWIDYSESSNEYYVIVFDDLEITIMADGTHAMHPCGQGAITPEQYEIVTGGD